jgi:hypothetical protein
MAAKPWGMIMLPLILVLPWRLWWKPLVTAGTIAAVAWLPFIIADAGTLEALKPAVRLEPDSLVHLVGFSDAPEWIRPVQLAATLAVGVLAVRRGRWPSVLLVGIATRLLLDPGTFTYYSSGLVLAALVWDLLRSATALPVWTMVTFWLLPILGIDQLTSTGQGVARVLITVGVVVSVCVPRQQVGPASGGKWQEPGT